MPWLWRGGFFAGTLCYWTTRGCRATLGIVGEVDVPVDSRKGRRALHAVPATDGIVNVLKLHKPHQLAIAIVAGAA